MLSQRLQCPAIGQILYMHIFADNADEGPKSMRGMSARYITVQAIATQGNLHESNHNHQRALFCPHQEVAEVIKVDSDASRKHVISQVKAKIQA